MNLAEEAQLARVEVEVEVDRLLGEVIVLREENAKYWAVARMRRALSRRLINRPPETMLDRLAPMRPGLSLNARPLSVPWGWVAVREPDRYAWRLLPCWLAWTLKVWANRWDVLVALQYKLGGEA